MWLTDSSIGRKLVMSLSGLFLIIFLTMHGLLNLVAVFSEEGYNEVCHFMSTNPIVQIMVPVLAAGFIVHIIYAVMLTLQNKKARGASRYVAGSKTAVAWSSKNMFVLGLVVLGFIAWHLTQFWAKMQLQEWMGNTAPQGVDVLKETFNCWIVVCLYVVWLIALWFHLAHGFWSAFQTIGWNNSIWYKRLKCIGTSYVTLLCLLFIFEAIWFGFKYGAFCCGTCLG